MAVVQTAFTLAVIAIVTLGTHQVNADGALVGGISDEKSPTPHVQELVTNLKDKLHSAMATNCAASNNGDGSACSACKELEPVSYKSQVVAGVNYFIKLRATGCNGGNSETFYVARIYEQPWTKTMEVTSVRGPQAQDQAITYF